VTLLRFSEDLRKWFDPKHPEGGWKRINTKGEVVGPCAREPGEAKPKCMSNEKIASLSKKERAAAVRAKRKHDPNPERKGKPINVSNYGKGKLSEDMEQLDEKSVPTNPELWSKAKSLARSKFDVYPSAYANGWAAKWYKSKGGGWKSMNEENTKDPREYNYEGDMTKSDLRSIMANAQKIHDMLEDDTNLPEWVQSKVTLAEDYISTVANYLTAEMNEEVKPELKRLGSNPGKFKKLVARILGQRAAKKIDGTDGERIMAKAKKDGNTNLFRQGSFIKNFYGEDVNEARYSRRVPAGQRLLKQIGEYEKRQQQGMEAAKKKEEQKPVKEEKSLGKPFRTPGGPKKFAVYVKNPESGNVKKVTFGDPNLSIKRDNPERRKSFRARHNCENPGPRTKARYWSCRQWRAGAKVEA
jgi:hypothetical protein